MFLMCAMSCSAVLSIMSTVFGRQNAGCKDTSTFYSLIVTLSAFVSWGVLFFRDFEFDVRVIGYSALYGLLYTVAMFGMFKAYTCGPVSLTAFVKQLSLIGVAFWGFVFWNTPVKIHVVLGLVLIVVSLVLCFKRRKEAKEHVVSLKWLGFALMLLVGNAGCSIVQKYQQLAFDGRFGNQLMFFGVGFSAITCLILYLRGERCGMKDIRKKASLLCPMVAGLSSAMLNLLILIMLSTTLSESVIFPGIAVGGLILTTIFSLIAYKERLTRIQWLGLVIGMVGLVFLNL